METRSAKVIPLRPHGSDKLTAQHRSIPRAVVSELAPPYQVMQSHLHADLDAYAEKYGRGAVEDLFEQWKRQA